MSNKKAIGENLCACVCTGVWSANNDFGKEKCLKSEMYKRNENKMEMHKQIKVKENWKKRKLKKFKKENRKNLAYGNKRDSGQNGIKCFWFVIKNTEIFQYHQFNY